jgi:hypothetical protein
MMTKSRRREPFLRGCSPSLAVTAFAIWMHRQRDSRNCSDPGLVIGRLKQARHCRKDVFRSAVREPVGCDTSWLAGTAHAIWKR